MQLHVSIFILFFTYFRQLKSSLIGSNKAKNRVIEAGVVPRLMNLLTDPNVNNIDLRVAVAYTLGRYFKINILKLKYVYTYFLKYIFIFQVLLQKARPIT